MLFRSKLKGQVDDLTARVAVADRRTRDAVNAKQMSTAKSSLRTQKEIQAALDKRMAYLNQLDGVYTQLEQAVDQVEIVEAMKGSALALKGLNQRMGGAEGVQEVMEALREETAKAEDISDIINEPGQAVDEFEVEEELAALENAENERVAAEKAKKEQAEAAKIAAKFAELEKTEKALKEKEEAEKTLKAKDEAQILQASQGLSNLSFCPENEPNAWTYQVDPGEETEEDEPKEKKKVPMPA